MNPEDREAFYDAEIAPALLALGKKCQDNGLSIVAEVEWLPGEGGTTATLQSGSGVGIRLVHLAAKARGNVDALILALMRHGKEHGHSSACLKLLGVEPSAIAPEG